MSEVTLPKKIMSVGSFLSCFIIAVRYSSSFPKSPVVYHSSLDTVKQLYSLLGFNTPPLAALPLTKYCDCDTPMLASGRMSFEVKCIFVVVGVIFHISYTTYHNRTELSNNIYNIIEEYLGIYYIENKRELMPGIDKLRSEIMQFREDYKKDV